MQLLEAIVSALVNVVFLGGLPLVGYVAFQRLRRGRSVAELLRCAGLQLGERRHLGYCIAVAIALVGLLLVFPPPLEPMTREGSAVHEFAGLGLSGAAISMALLYGVFETGLTEELLFRGLIAGSLGRGMRIGWACFWQALIFLAPHLLVLSVAPELGWMLPVIFVFALFVGWARIRSGSILGPWLIHAAVNVTTALSIAARTAT